jgi:tetratricopeptide (TPR) repeat protein
VDIDALHLGLPACRVHLADGLMRQGQLKDARRALEAALGGFQVAKDSVGAANAMLALGGLALRTREAEDAEMWLTRAASAYADTGIRLGLAEAHNRLGELARMRNDFDEAERRYHQAVTGFASIGSSDGLIPSLNLAQVMLERERWLEALEVLGQANDDATAGNRRDLVACVHVMRLPALAAIGDWSAFDAALQAATEQLAEIGLVHPDLGDQALTAALKAVDAGEAERAKGAAALAGSQWGRLGRADKQAEVRKLLDGLN